MGGLGLVMAWLWGDYWVDWGRLMGGFGRDWDGLWAD